MLGGGGAVEERTMSSVANSTWRPWGSRLSIIVNSISAAVRPISARGWPDGRKRGATPNERSGGRQNPRH